jgi:hypothetical protein
VVPKCTNPDPAVRSFGSVHLVRKLFVGIGAVLVVLAIGVGWLSWSHAASVEAPISEPACRTRSQSTTPGGSFKADSSSKNLGTLYIFGPYTAPDEVRETLGFAWDRADKADMSVDDGNCLLSFTKNGSVVTYAKVPARKVTSTRRDAEAYRPGTVFTKQPNPTQDNWPLHRRRVSPSGDPARCACPRRPGHEPH